MPEFTRYAPPAGSNLRVPSINGEWMGPFMEQMEPFLASARQQSNYTPLGVALQIALPADTGLLTGHPLVGFLEPLVIAFALPQLRFAAATKRHGLLSTLCVGPVGLSKEGPDGWHTARARCEDVSVKAQRVLAQQIAMQAHPARWGPSQVDLAIRTGVLRDWIVTWRPLIESLVAFLGRRRAGAREFEVEDGRIVALALHHDVDPLLGNAIEVDVRFRALGKAEGPPLDYFVLGDARIPSTSRA